MDSLPPDVKRKVGRCLESKDALSLRRVNKGMKLDMALTTLLPPLQLLAHGHWTDRTCTPICGPEIPLLFGPGRFHSVTLKCTWRDQGWGNRKSQLFVVGRNRRNASLPIIPRPQWNIQNGHVLYSSPIAEHREQQLTITFYPRDDVDTYHLWYKVGGGGGHELFVNNLKVYTIINEDNENYKLKIYKALEDKEVFSRNIQNYRNATGEVFSAWLLLSLTEIPVEGDPEITLFLSLFGLQGNSNNMNAIREFGRFLVDYQRRALVDSEEVRGPDSHLRILNRLRLQSHPTLTLDASDSDDEEEENFFYEAEMDSDDEEDETEMD